jgi:hypothetical protein
VRYFGFDVDKVLFQELVVIACDIAGQECDWTREWYNGLFVKVGPLLEPVQFQDPRLFKPSR